jgi:predicted NUDIX family NTP pyrophosphohydrolase
MAKTSAGLLLYRFSDRALQVFLAHPGGPLWARKDLGAWSIPKGELDPAGEDALTAARREFAEETGQQVTGDFIPLTPRKQPGGKTVQAWAVEAECDPGAVRSNLFTMEWPPRSGRRQEFPEIDRAEWFSVDEARGKILKGQAGFLDELVEKLASLPTHERPSS